MEHIHCGCGHVYRPGQTLSVCPECGSRHYRFGVSSDDEE